MYRDLAFLILCILFTFGVALPDVSDVSDSPEPTVQNAPVQICNGPQMYQEYQIRQIQDFLRR